MATDLRGDGLQGGAQIFDLAGKPGEGVRLAGSGTVLLDDGSQLRTPVEGGPSNAGSICDGVEGDGLAGLGELGASDFDPSETVVIGHDT